MECTKCNGFLVRENISDYYIVCYPWRCINCGTVLFRNPKQQRRKKVSRDA